MYFVVVENIETLKIMKVFPCEDYQDGLSVWHRVLDMVRQTHQEHRVFVCEPESALDMNPLECARIKKAWNSQREDREARAICESLCNDR